MGESALLKPVNVCAFTTVESDVIVRFPKSNFVKPASFRKVGFEEFPETDNHILGGGYNAAHKIHVDINIFVIHPVNDLLFKQVL